MSTLIGFKKFTGKNGKDYCVANVLGDYSARDIERGCVGQKVEEVFLPNEQFNYLNSSDVGKPVKMEFEYSGNRAYLVSFVIEGHK